MIRDQFVTINITIIMLDGIAEFLPGSIAEL